MKEKAKEKKGKREKKGKKGKEVTKKGINPESECLCKRQALRNHIAKEN